MLTSCVQAPAVAADLADSTKADFHDLKETEPSSSRAKSARNDNPLLAFVRMRAKNLARDNSDAEAKASIPTGAFHIISHMLEPLDP